MLLGTVEGRMWLGLEEETSVMLVERMGVEARRRARELRASTPMSGRGARKILAVDPLAATERG